MPILSFFTSKPFLILGALAAFTIVLWFWRGEIYRAAENACVAAVGQKTIEKNNQSRKDADGVRKKEQTKSKCGVIDGLHYELGILRENRSCSE